MRASLALLSLTTAVYAFHDSALLRARNLVDSPDALSDSYDFVIVGGGLAGAHTKTFWRFLLVLKTFFRSCNRKSTL